MSPRSWIWAPMGSDLRLARICDLRRPDRNGTVGAQMSMKSGDRQRASIVASAGRQGWPTLVRGSGSLDGSVMLETTSAHRRQSTATRWRWFRRAFVHLPAAQRSLGRIRRCVDQSEHHRRGPRVDLCAQLLGVGRRLPRDPQGGLRGEPDQRDAHGRGGAVRPQRLRAHAIVTSGERAAAITELRDAPALESVVVIGAGPLGTVPFEELLAADGALAEIVAPAPTSLSTIGYTSGTTGHPKGAMQSTWRSTSIAHSTGRDAGQRVPTVSVECRGHSGNPDSSPPRKCASLSRPTIPTRSWQGIPGI